MVNRTIREVDRGVKTGSISVGAGLDFAAKKAEEISAGLERLSRQDSRSSVEAPTVSPIQPRSIREPRSARSFQRELMKTAQGEVDALREYYAGLEAQQREVNEQRNRGTASVNTLTGLAGSTEANVTTNATTAVNERDMKTLQAEKQAAIQQVLGRVSQQAVEEARLARSEFQEELRFDEERRLRAREEAITNASLLAGAGVTAEGYAQTDPTGYQYLAEQVGGEQILKSMFTLNRPQETILDKRIEGGKYVIAYQNPLDGKVRLESVDLGLPTGYSQTIDAGDRILAVPDDWSGDPAELVTINKGLNPTTVFQASRSTSGASTASNDVTPFANDLEALVGNVYNIIPSENGKEAFRNTIQRARDDSDIINSIATVALRNTPGPERSDFIKQSQAIGELEKAIAKVESGVQTGVLQAGAQYMFNLAGKDFDPELQAINSHIITALQPYRSSITGAAFSEAEMREYEKIFGSGRLEPEALILRLKQAKQMMMDKSTTALSAQIAPFNDQSVFNYGGASYNMSEATDDLRSRVEAMGLDYDAMRADGHSDEEIRAAIENQ